MSGISMNPAATGPAYTATPPAGLPAAPAAAAASGSMPQGAPAPAASQASQTNAGNPAASQTNAASQTSADNAAITGGAANGAPANTSWGAALQPDAASHAPANSSPAANPAANPASQQAASGATTPPAPDAAAPPVSGQGAPGGNNADADHRPIEDWSKVDLQLGDALVDASLVEDFGQAAVASGLTPAQARAIVQGHVRHMQRQADARLANERKTLEAAWGRDMPARLQQVETLCQRLGRMPGCENFRAALEQSGGASSAAVIMGLHAIAQALGEDSKGRFASGGLSGKETVLEGIRSVFGLGR